MGDVSGGAVAVNHAAGRVAGVRELVEDAVRDVNGLAGGYGLAFFAEAHLGGTFDDEVDLFLLLVVPGDLAAIGLEGDVAHAEAGGLDGAGSADQVLSAAAG